MTFISPGIGFSAIALIGLVLVFNHPAWSGGDADNHDHHDDGPSYFGFIKDASGRTVPDAKVTAEIKGRGSVVTRSDKVGIYKLPGFGKDMPPNNVIISCSKDGYRQIRTFRRPPPPGKGPVAAVETECTLQRVAPK